MNTFTEFLSSNAVLLIAIGVIVAALVLHRFVLRLFGMIIIPEDSIGIVTKKFVLFGDNKSLPDGTVIALNGEAGIQADTLAPGVHFWLWPWQYEISVQRFITISPGELGIVTARDGRPLSDSSVRMDCRKKIGRCGPLRQSGDHQ